MMAIAKADNRLDRYPSRNGQAARIVRRQDPVVYAPDLAGGPIEANLVAQYRDQGFLILDDVFSMAEVAELQQELDRLRHSARVASSEETIRESGSGELRSIFRVHEISPVFALLAADCRLAGLARFLLDDQVYLHQSRVNYKPGLHGREFYWHSDFETWHVEDGMPAMRALSMSITLTENYAENGPVMLIPGSHHHYVVCEGNTPEEHFKASLKKQEYGVPSDACLAKLVAEGGIVSAVSKPGSVILFDCNTLHGSNGNITPWPRSNVFFVYNALSNQVQAPYCDQPPRPEYICSRQQIRPVMP